ncbi:outer membrane protein assembly complex, YaeT protein [Candidatus Omnitrophus magneticus]|uniref:Outer membrane protein assembly factor BamA n=1 Tax=Candidatus Omnitrophus magneticus TaxID=1609969 RepID=A0A0F0CQP7_9BACT|nr:outer membrane protein assembly complex, YaeT protein [Candidatus Omnitrophus magneticus]
MFKKIAIFFAIIFSFYVTGVGHNVIYAESTDKHIVDIKIKGNSAVSTATIINRLKLKPGDVYEPAALNNELKRLYAMGYFNDVSVETEDQPEGVIVVFTVVEKPIISTISFRGNARLKANTLKKKITIKDGDLIDFNRVAQDVATLKAYYIEQGYSKAKVDYVVEQPDKDQGANLVFVIDEGVVLKVKTIKVEGNEHIKSGEITKFMSTKTAWWFIRKGAYDEEKFQEDLTRVATFYRSKGYLDVKVTSRFDYSSDGKFMYITIVVEEGKLYKVGAIALAGTMVFPNEDLTKLVKMKNGDAFDYEKIRADIESIRTFYYDRGYMDAEVDLKQQFNSSTGNMDLNYNIDAHEEVYVGMVNVFGNTKTKDKVVRREVRVYPGEKYDGKKLKRSKERIYNLGFFEDVYFETVPTDQKNVKDLNVTVKESKTGEFSFGGGYSSVDAFIGFVQLSQKNFDIMNFPTFTGAGQNLVIRAEGGSSRSNYFLSWTDPWIFDYPFSFGFDIYREEHNRSGLSGYDYDERRTGGNLRLGKELSEYVTTDLIYNLEEVQISDVPDESSEDLRKEQGRNIISRLTWGINYDTRDNKFSPSKGLVLGSSLQDAGGILGGDKDFVKGWFHGSYFQTLLIENVVLELKGATGIAKPYGDTEDVPIYERYFAGGASTIRGYKQRSVGPRDKGSNSALGGEAVVLGSAEVTFPIYQNIIKGAVFFDTGSIWKKTNDLFNSSSEDYSGFKHGTGIGVRVKTPIGPVKLDYGFPLSDNQGDKREGQFYFSISNGF